MKREGERGRERPQNPACISSIKQAQMYYTKICIFSTSATMLVPSFEQDIASARLTDAATTQRSDQGEPILEGTANPELCGGDTNSAVTSSFTRPSSPPSRSSGPDVVVLIDGTWTQAKQILGRYPCLTDKFVVRKPWLLPKGENLGSSCAEGTSGPGADLQVAARDGFSSDKFAEKGDAECFCRAVKFRSAGSSGYGFRKEPSEECISTLESVAYTLEVGGWVESLAAGSYPGISCSRCTHKNKTGRLLIVR